MDAVHDPLEKRVNQLANIRYFSNFGSILILYWDHYKSQMMKLFEEHYPKEELPKWVNYDLFRINMISSMVQTLFTEIIENDFHKHSSDTHIDVDFSYDLGLALYSQHLDTGRSGIFSDVSRLNINMTVDYIQGG